MSHTTTDKLFGFVFGVSGRSPDQSRRASGVYTGLPVFWHRRSDSFEETTKCAFETFEFVLDVFVLGDRGSRNTKPAYQGMARSGEPSPISRMGVTSSRQESLRFCS